MESTVLEDEGADLHRRKVQFQYFSVHNVFHRSPRRQKKVTSSAKFLRKKKVLYIVFLREDEGRRNLVLLPLLLSVLLCQIRIIGWTCKAS